MAENTKVVPPKKSANKATDPKSSGSKKRPKKAPVTVTSHDFGGSEIGIGDLVDITFQRTLRVSESGLNGLPPGLGMFPLRVVESLGDRATAAMVERGGVVMPIYQREAMWLSFHANVPVAIQIATGLRCAITGNELEKRLRHRKQNFLVGTTQPWLDGFKTESGEVRQFVAARLGDGATVEEQLSDESPVGGVQIVVWELTDEALARWKSRQDRWVDEMPSVSGMCFSIAPLDCRMDMGVGAGGLIQQEIYRSDFAKSDWKSEPSARVWVHLTDASNWTALTGEPQPSTPVTARTYADWGYPWFDYFDADHVDVDGSPVLAGVKTVGQVLGGDDDGASMHPGAAVVTHLGPSRRPQRVRTPRWD